MKPVTPQVITATILVVAIAGAIARMAGSNSNEDLKRFQGRPVHYVVTVLAQEEAKPGKVVRASNQNRTLAQYVCVSNDIAVAVISLDTQGGQPPVHTDLGRATGSDGKTFPVSIRKDGNIYFLTLKRSSRRVPNKITVPLLFYGTTGPAKIGVTSLNVEFIKIDKSEQKPPVGSSNGNRLMPRQHTPEPLN